MGGRATANLTPRPKKFVKNTYGQDEDEDSTVGKMPPSDSDEEGS
jgi:probable RNA-binding protein EIF1AD